MYVCMNPNYFSLVRLKFDTAMYFLSQGVSWEFRCGAKFFRIFFLNVSK